MTDVIDGPSGANGQPGRKDERESFSTMTVGNSPGRDAQAAPDAVVNPDQQSDPDGVAAENISVFHGNPPVLA